MIERSSATRVLAIDPTTRGFAYVVFEGPDFLLEWGSSQARAGEKNAKCMARIRELVARYDPEVIVLENYEGPGSNRRPRVRALRAFAAYGGTTKRSIAVELAKCYPELSPRLPDERKCYESEDERMNLFDAASLALTYFERHRRRPKPTGLEAA